MELINRNIQKILNKLDEGVYCVDKDRKIKFWNKRAEEITGFKSTEVKNKHCYDNILNHIDETGNDLCKDHCPLLISIKEGIEQEERVFLHHKKGHRIPVKVKTLPATDEQGDVVGAIQIFCKEFEEFNILEDKDELIKFEMLDTLTDLPNRKYLKEELEFKINEVNYTNKNYGLFLMNIDDLAVVNDKNGRNVGDSILKAVSKTLKENLRKLDIVGRWGKDEFVGIIKFKKTEDISVVTEKLRVLIKNTEIRVGELSVKITVSVGATIINSEESIEEIISRADKLMYLSKIQGKDRVNVD